MRRGTLSATDGFPPFFLRKHSTKKAILLAVLAMPFFFTGCGGDPEQEAYDDMKSVIVEMTDIVSEIKDEETAKEAAVELTELGKKMKDMQKKYEDEGQIRDGKDFAEKLTKEQNEEMQELMQKYIAETMRVMQIEGAQEHLEKAFEAMAPDEK
jgi:hypothetical protein